MAPLREEGSFSHLSRGVTAATKTHRIMLGCSLPVYQPADSNPPADNSARAFGNAASGQLVAGDPCAAICGPVHPIGSPQKESRFGTGRAILIRNSSESG
jgi:hypothetical protein